MVYSLDTTQYLHNMGFLSRQSKSFSFDARADGYARGEGFGVLIIKPLSTAIADRDPIRALIRSTHTNSDGYTQGITVPNGRSQTELIRKCYAKAGLDMGLTRFVEAHGKLQASKRCKNMLNHIMGTGTFVGDPIEANAIGTAFQEFTSPSNPLYM